MDRSLNDLTGRKFGKWVVLPRNDFESNHLHYNWLVQCECGRLRHVAGQALEWAVLFLWMRIASQKRR
jgi:hypothetical protein